MDIQEKDGTCLLALFIYSFNYKFYYLWLMLFTDYSSSFFVRYPVGKEGWKKSVSYGGQSFPDLFVYLSLPLSRRFCL